MSANDAYWKVTVMRVGKAPETYRTSRVSYEVFTDKQRKAEAAAEKMARDEYGGRWIATLVSGPQGGPFRS